ncbi:MAG: hypothetical protein ACT4PU_07530 [Planctomycetota bacterium]
MPRPFMPGARSLVALALCALLGVSAPAQSVTTWLPTFGDLNGQVETLCVYDDGLGGGPALYVGGYFTMAGEVPAARIARWDGQHWSAVGSGFSYGVHSLAVFDAGNGPELYAGGVFTFAPFGSQSRIARWNGVSWKGVGSGIPGSGLPVGAANGVYALEVYDDGSGPALYAGGDFSKAGGLSVNNLARWDGSAWSALGEDFHNFVEDLESFDDGSGAKLYACGQYSDPPGPLVDWFAQWDGVSWETVGGAGNGVNNATNSLAVHDDGNGPALYVGGSFQKIGGQDLRYLARWDGSSWSSLGAGPGGPPHALLSFDDGLGGGPQLYAGGSFSTAGGAPAARIARWDGTAWWPLEAGLDSQVSSLTSFNGTAWGGPALIVGGWFQQAGGMPASRIAQWGVASTAAWQDLGSALPGVAGEPQLLGLGTAAAGEPAALRLAQAAPLATAHLFLSMASTPTPFFGGVLVPVPVAQTFSLTTNGAGALSLSFAEWPSGVPAGFELWFQYAVLDFAAPQGVALSRAVKLTTP